MSRFVRLLMATLLLAFAAARPANAQDATVLRDSETELLFRDASAPLIRAAGLSPKSVDVVLLNDPEINAFVATGQRVYIQSGLIAATDNVSELQGVIAHELGHVAGGHSIRLNQGVSQASTLSIATMVLGALAMAAGAGTAGMGILMAGNQVAMSRLLAFSRTQESTADQAGAKYLSGAGISGKGIISFFGKLQNQEYRLAIYAKDSYDRTHPLSNERVSALTQTLKADPAWDRPTDPELEARFQRVKAKLLGFVNPKQATIKYPEKDQSVPAHYARAYAYHLSGYPDKALAETNALLATAPHDPFYLELKGQILLESGKPAEAIAPLREATERSGEMPLIAAMLGHALIATEKPGNTAEAKQVLKAAVNRDNQNPFAWYQLGMIYDREGDQPRAALATAERNNLEGNPKLALASAEMALRGIPAGSPDYLRAQDIAMVSRAELKKKKKGKNDS
ncbi:M48 family metalloprotease [Sphingomonas sinipercae]|uniref:M48 family metalloprotease n=1 Tax=Sphingomonas sinipercae TaxID=2714944 RepID=A0A6G7ZR70_9SPHN|nr:M48 family metalloprotease [Sphingomonas sinipercae]